MPDLSWTTNVRRSARPQQMPTESLWAREAELSLRPAIP
jgi:hypothetical protein